MGCLFLILDLLVLDFTADLKGCSVAAGDDGQREIRSGSSYVFVGFPVRELVALHDDLSILSTQVYLSLKKTCLSSLNAPTTLLVPPCLYLDFKLQLLKNYVSVSFSTIFQ